MTDEIEHEQPFAELRAEVAHMQATGEAWAVARTEEVAALIASYDRANGIPDAVTGLDAMRAHARMAGSPPVAFVRIELGGRLEDLAIHNPGLLLSPSPEGVGAASQFTLLFLDKLRAMIRAGLADRVEGKGP